MQANPPARDALYDFSLQRNTRRFRFRLVDDAMQPTGDEWLCDRLYGEMEPVSETGDGHLYFRTYLTLDEGPNGVTAHCYAPDGVEFDVLPPELAKESHWRLCAAKEREEWRLRDERTGELRHVKAYRGLMDVNWDDSGTHIFCDMGVYVDNENVAHFGKVGVVA